MLQSLKIKNYALIQDIEIHFDNGLNVITGETGAGKSIVLGALGLSLGNRADTQVLRNKEKKCVVEAVFNIETYGLRTLFESEELDYEEVTIFRREISPEGKSRAFINDTPVKINTLQLFSSSLIEIHSQHDNLSLFKNDFQFEIVDALCHSEKEYQNYFEAFKKLENLKKGLSEIEQTESILKKEYDFNCFLLEELEVLKLETIDEQEMMEKLEMLNNMELYQEVIQKSKFLLEGENGILDQLMELRKSFESLPKSVHQPITERLQDTQEELRDVALDIYRKDQQTELDPSEIQSLNELQHQLAQLKLKHRVDSVLSLIEIQKDLSEKVQESNDISDQIIRLKKEIIIQSNIVMNLGEKLAEKRNKNVPEVEAKINGLLSQLGMQHSRIRVTLQKTEIFRIFGLQSLAIELSSDGGKQFLEIKKAASGGELARISLSIKSELSEVKGLPTSIFDEIDTGVSGDIARKVGLLMEKMSSNMQIITITHLPQIASLGSSHFFIYKNKSNDEVSTEVKKLSPDERIQEIAKMISGDTTTTFALEQGKALLNLR